LGISFSEPLSLFLVLVRAHFFRIKFEIHLVVGAIIVQNSDLDQTPEKLRVCPPQPSVSLSPVRTQAGKFEYHRGELADFRILGCGKFGQLRDIL